MPCKASNQEKAMERKQGIGTKPKQAITEGQGTGSNGGKKGKGRLDASAAL